MLAVGSADPVGLRRLVVGLGDLRDAVPAPRVVVAVNRLRAGALGADPEEEVRSVLSRYAGVQPLAVVPDDRAAVDAALTAARPLTEVAPASPARLALQGLATSLVGSRPPSRRRRLLLRR